MPPRESISRPPRTDVYAVMLVLGWVFLALAVVITWVELKSDYDFMGTETGIGAMEAQEPTDAAPPPPAPATTAEEPAM